MPPVRRLSVLTSSKQTNTHKLAFSLLALTLFILELWVRQNAQSSINGSLWWILPTTMFLAYSGWRPVIGGVAITTIATLTSLAPETHISLGVLFIGIFAVAFDWISKGWWVGAALVLIVPQLAQLSTPGGNGTVGPGIVVGSSIAIVGGLSVRYFQQQELLLKRERELLLQQERVASERALEQITQAQERAQRQIRQELASTLHDTLAADLVRISLSSHSLSHLINDPETVEIARELEEASRSTLRDLRAVIAATKDYHPDEASPTTESVVQTCRSMLSARSISLVADLPENLDAGCALELRKNIALIIQESAINILKYGKEGSTASRSIEIPEGNEEVIDLMFSNECSTGPVENQGEISGGFGLASLSARIANSGGFLDASQRGRRWVLVAQLVGRMKE